ncbi:hypothetical protein ACFWSF_15570 [Streptomyces sp. NPDC058611]
MTVSWRRSPAAAGHLTLLVNAVGVEVKPSGRGPPRRAPARA